MNLLFTPGSRASLTSLGLDALAGWINTPADAVYTAAAPMGGMMEMALLPGSSKVATLKLDAAAIPGEDVLTFTNGQVVVAEGDLTAHDMSDGQTFTIRVGQLMVGAANRH